MDTTTLVKSLLKNVTVYPDSVHTFKNSVIAMSNESDITYLVIVGDAEGFVGDLIPIEGGTYVRAPLTHQNAINLRKLFPFTKPIPVLRKERSIGLGDRLGLAGDGHTTLFKKYDAYPILAQQSMRELTLTQRTYEDVLDAATFATFKNDFQKGFGADGDHLKKADDIERVLNLGYTMITLDCSDYIKNDVLTKKDDEIFSSVVLPEDIKNRYLNQHFIIEGHSISFTLLSLSKAYYVYQEALMYTKTIYDKFFKPGLYEANFELSIDETLTPTLPEEHYFVASELHRLGVQLDTLAPRFCGEFQKGIDYIGDIGQFEQELKVHAAIARTFDYKLSIHSGSDKFSIFSIIGKHTRGRFHLKTAGTNWLEAMKIVAIKDPSLYREVHRYALDMFAEAKKLYHVSTQLQRIPSLDTLTDAQLPSLFDHIDARQLIHITYGYILTAKDEHGLRFKPRLYRLWHEFDKNYADALISHIGRHIDLLYRGFQS